MIKQALKYFIEDLKCPYFELRAVYNVGSLVGFHFKVKYQLAHKGDSGYEKKLGVTFLRNHSEQLSLHLLAKVVGSQE